MVGLGAQLASLPEEETKGRTSKAVGYWDEHFGANIGASYAYGFDRRSYRAYSYAKLKWKNEMDEMAWIVFNIEGLVFRRDYNYILELNPEDTGAFDKSIRALDAKIRGDTTPGDNPQADVVCSRSHLSGLHNHKLKERLKRECDERESRQ